MYSQYECFFVDKSKLPGLHMEPSHEELFPPLFVSSFSRLANFLQVARLSCLLFTYNFPVAIVFLPNMSSPTSPAFVFISNRSTVNLKRSRLKSDHERSKGRRHGADCNQSEADEQTAYLSRSAFLERRPCLSSLRSRTPSDLQAPT